MEQRPVGPGGGLNIEMINFFSMKYNHMNITDGANRNIFVEILWSPMVARNFFSILGSLSYYFSLLGDQLSQKPTDPTSGKPEAAEADATTCTRAHTTVDQDGRNTNMHRHVAKHANHSIDDQ